MRAAGPHTLTKEAMARPSILDPMGLNTGDPHNGLPCSGQGACPTKWHSQTECRAIRNNGVVHDCDRAQA